MILLDIFTFLGRLHPLIIHLPIGFLLLAIIFDGISYHKKYGYLIRAVPFTLLIGFASAAAACVLGFMLSFTGDYDDQILNNHKFSGISLTLTAGILYVMTTTAFRKIISMPRALFSGLSIATLFLLGYTGHQGASLTHGNNYISLETLMRQERAKPTQVEEAMIFEDVVHPVLEQRCAQCHQAGKKKGRLSMESMATMLKGGKHGPAVVPGNLTESELFQRIALDPSHEDFMPADGKTPLTKTETELIRWWIEKAMAVEGKKISELKDYQAIRLLAASSLGLGGKPHAALGSLTGQKINENIPDTLEMTLVENLRKKGLVVRLMSQKPAMLDVTLPPGSGKTMDDIVNELKPVSRNIIWLNLSGNGFTENDLGILKLMSNMEKLRLEKNPISDGISNHLVGLNYLEAVNLNETKITTACVSRLRQNPAIKRIYTWKSRVDNLNNLLD
ncbi:MAG: c-type cytochrome domain-containing protein [Cyclobacteriaceae bacterium]